MRKLPVPKNYSPDAPGQTNAGIFGLPHTAETANFVVYPVPWEVTVSYRAGTAKGPEAIRAASPQLDLFDEIYGNVWQYGIAMAEANADIVALNAATRPKAAFVIEALEAGADPEENPELIGAQTQVDLACLEMSKIVEAETKALLDAGKMVVLVGGDHSTPLGYFRALQAHYGDFGILQIDAHLDLRDSYEGFEYSHASIMHNVLKEGLSSQIVSVGVRDFSEGEWNIAREDIRVEPWGIREIRKRMYERASWADTCRRIVAYLPHFVYISFDIDGLDPSLCPHTGTPVPGGLGFEEVRFFAGNSRRKRETYHRRGSCGSGART
ncbi:MAG: agmatinase family protein, partial [Bacteroidota bacterium]